MKYIQENIFNTIAMLSSIVRWVGGPFKSFARFYPEYLYLATTNIASFKRDMQDHTEKKELLLDQADTKVKEAHELIGE